MCARTRFIDSVARSDCLHCCHDGKGKAPSFICFFSLLGVGLIAGLPAQQVVSAITGGLAVPLVVSELLLLQVPS